MFVGILTSKTALLVVMGVLMTAAHARAAVLPTVVRGARAIVLRPEPGPLSIKIFKRDLNIYEGSDEITAHLFDPCRQQIATASLPDDGQDSGHSQTTQVAEMHVNCTARGTYRLLIAGSPRSDFVFGLDISQGGYMVEGRIMLNDGAQSGVVCFQPPSSDTTMRARALHGPGRHKMPLVDASGDVIHTFDMTETGRWAEFVVTEGVGDRTGPWRLEVGNMDVDIEVPGVLYWNCDAAALFAADRYRHMLYPFCATRYLQPGESADITYTLRNQTGVTGGFALNTEADDGLDCSVIEPQSPATLSHELYHNSLPLTVRVQVARSAAVGKELHGRIVASAGDDPAVVQSAGVRVIAGPSPVSEPLAGPVVLHRYQHENYQFGYAPDYIENEVYFDLNNRPYIRERTSHKYRAVALTLLENDKWVQRSYVPAVQEIYPDYRGFYMGGGSIGAKVAFDGADGAYTLLSVLREIGTRRQSVLIYTPDAGKTYTVHPFEGGSFDIEQFTGHNALDTPPPVLAYRKTRDHPARFCSYHDLLLYLPAKMDGKLQMGEPVLVSDRCLGSCQHSGGPASTVTRDGKTHIVWGDVAEDEDNAPGVPTYVATYDHATRTLGEPVLLAYGPPVNDVHNVPAITMDSEGYIHILTGAHGDNFRYLRSLKPDDAYSGFTEPVNILEAGYVDAESDADGSGRQTYISLVCGPDDTLYTAYRQWRMGVDDYHGSEIYAALSFQSKPKGEAWGPAQPRVIPAVSGYSIYYHKLTVDRLGNLYLSYSYWTSDVTYQADYPEHYHNRAIQVSRDRGESWKLAETADFAAAIVK